MVPGSQTVSTLSFTSKVFLTHVWDILLGMINPMLKSLKTSLSTFDQKYRLVFFHWERYSAPLPLGMLQNVIRIN